MNDIFFGDQSSEHILPEELIFKKKIELQQLKNKQFQEQQLIQNQQSTKIKLKDNPKQPSSNSKKYKQQIPTKSIIDSDDDYDYFN